MNKDYDIIVIGAGHAGCEAALASARLHMQTALITIDDHSLARMSCNPAIGGIAKSHLVCELDALGGEMGRNTDFTGIQFRTLNTRKGPAVQAKRVQSDKNRYPDRMKAIITSFENLTLIKGLVTDITVKNGKACGVTCKDGRKIRSKAVIVCAGTFLNGVTHIGMQQIKAGRVGEEAAEELSENLKKMGFRMERLKTGTPPRLHRDSLDYSKMDIQPGEEPPTMFSTAAKNEMFHVEQAEMDPHEAARLFHVEHFDKDMFFWVPGSNQIPCYLTHTNEKTHQIIADNLKRSALYGGAIEGTGVRYCPSIEDKIVKFSGRGSHHVFVEPEGRDNVRIYPNGTSNSLPEDIQMEMIHSIVGLEKAAFIRPGYAIEYDFSDPTQLRHSLESKRIENLYFAGQINGTTGYEEAACQGFMAGINAVNSVLKKPAFTLDRSEAYIGIMIDDLVTKGTDEPYRMFTSRAECRLTLRQSNARYRLLEKARALGILDTKVTDEAKREWTLIQQEVLRLKKIYLDGRSLAQHIRNPEKSYRSVSGTDRILPDFLQDEIEVEIKYEGYIAREAEEAARMKRMQTTRIPDDFDYNAIDALRFEAREKLKQVLPEDLGQAARIPGVNPPDIAILAVWIKRHNAK